MTRLYVTRGIYPEDYLRDTVDYIARVQDSDGAIPWFPGGILDPWDHVESAMGLTIGGRFDEAAHAYEWLKQNQLDNGSWLAAYKDGEVEDGTRAESNFVAYVATGVWHYYLVTADRDFLENMWPVVENAMGFVLRLQGGHGQIYWCEDTTLGIQKDSLITGCSSIYKSLECAINIATILERRVSDWDLARTKLGNALRNHPEVFDRTWDSKSRFAMDWFYPVLTGVIRGARGRQHLHSRWDTFVVDQFGCHCVSDEPWVTVAESCELVMSLLAVGERHKAAELFSWLHQFKDEDGSYWTGYVHSDEALWPLEKPTWTAGAILLAADALAEKTSAAKLFTQESTVPTAKHTKRANDTNILK
ncbi:MAG: hypothetical protein ACI82A_002365 [Candidatus Azotimanducaceae bacterium]|jgi:hypothetical protein